MAISFAGWKVLALKEIESRTRPEIFQGEKKGKKDRRTALGRVNNRRIKVVYKEKENYKRIITIR